MTAWIDRLKEIGKLHEPDFGEESARVWDDIVAVIEAVELTRPIHCNCSERCFDCTKEECDLSQALGALKRKVEK